MADADGAVVHEVGREELGLWISGLEVDQAGGAIGQRAAPHIHLRTAAGAQARVANRALIREAAAIAERHACVVRLQRDRLVRLKDRKSTRLNSSHLGISDAV